MSIYTKLLATSKYTEPELTYLITSIVNSYCQSYLQEEPDSDLQYYIPSIIAYATDQPIPTLPPEVASAKSFGKWVCQFETKQAEKVFGEVMHQLSRDWQAYHLEQFHTLVQEGDLYKFLPSIYYSEKDCLFLYEIIKIVFGIFHIRLNLSHLKFYLRHHQAAKTIPEYELRTNISLSSSKELANLLFSTEIWPLAKQEFAHFGIRIV
jgi:hypothetical protein